MMSLSYFQRTELKLYKTENDVKSLQIPSNLKINFKLNSWLVVDKNIKANKNQSLELPEDPPGF